MRVGAVSLAHEPDLLPLVGDLGGVHAGVDDLPVGLDEGRGVRGLLQPGVLGVGLGRVRAGGEDRAAGPGVGGREGARGTATEITQPFLKL